MASKQITYLLSISSSKFESPEISPKNPPATPKVWLTSTWAALIQDLKLVRRNHLWLCPSSNLWLRQSVTSGSCSLGCGNPNLRIRNSGSKGRLYVYQHLQRGAKWFLKVSIHHPLGFNWHPFEAPGIPGNSAGDLFGMVKTWPFKWLLVTSK